jgi:hypothetical protein
MWKLWRASGIVHKLGLRHYKTGDFVYRMELNINRYGLRAPTVLDACLEPAWAPPTPGFPHPWGVTRHLETGLAEKPELLAETSDHLGEHPTAKLVSPAGKRTAVGIIKVDLLAGRA